MSDAFRAAWVLPGNGAVALTCEHASVAMPEPWAWPQADRWLVGTHWSFDLGAEDLTRELAAYAGWGAVMAGFTRLLVDPNRDLDARTLFRTQADRRPVHLNAGLSEAERARRIERLWRPYHRAASDLVGSTSSPLVCGIHTFTPVYEGKRREVEVGVLFNRQEAMARQVASKLLEGGYHVRLNEPWSGRDELMFGPERCAHEHDRLALEIEVRQDRATDPEWRERFLPRLCQALTQVAPS
ncbi:MAG: hypothetical protein EA397_05705 [Deltaproteobacteria bacterium]|nr:MAG: hypothetical protein EA397_05705 [Deltaproteobacteria bacterium]